MKIIVFSIYLKIYKKHKHKNNSSKKKKKRKTWQEILTKLHFIFFTWLEAEMYLDLHMSKVIHMNGPVSTFHFTNPLETSHSFKQAGKLVWKLIDIFENHHSAHTVIPLCQRPSHLSISLSFIIRKQSGIHWNKGVCQPFHRPRQHYLIKQ